MDIRKLTRGAFFLALGVVLPQVFHLIGGQATGQMFLPMHIPVLLAGFLVCPWAGLYVGLLSPFISHLLTGMPPMAPVPILVLMSVELPLMGMMAGLLHRRLKLNIFVSLPVAMLAGRLGIAVAFMVLTSMAGLELGSLWAYVTGAVVTGLPGIAMQLVLVPLLVAGLERGVPSWAETSK